jgi:hypothetical protein
MTAFTEVQPSLDNYWRAVILFGRNVASYKFALGRTLLDLADERKTFVPLTDLALPFARHLSTHLKDCDKQATSRSSRFLDECRKFNRGELTETQLAEATTKLGFNNVIDAFHVVGAGPIPVRFFEDERDTAANGIRLTDDLFRLTESIQHRNLPHEVEARWRLVETAWELSLPTTALVVDYDPATETLVTAGRMIRRKAVAPCRDALNGYQKGKCFYCFRDVSVAEGAIDLADVDHLLPHALKVRLFGSPLAGIIDGIWNLVLTCQTCNRGERGKFDNLPALNYVERLRTRNEYLIASHHPLRETLMAQTGETEQGRHAFLRQAYKDARTNGGLVGQPWRAVDECAPAF